MLCYENRLTFPIYISDQRFENSMDLLLVIDDDKSHYVHINILTYLCFTKRKIKTKKTFVRVVYSVLVAQSVRLEKGTIEFKNYFKQIPVPFKIYADFECNLKSVKSYEGSYPKKYQDHVPCSFAYKLLCVDDEFQANSCF